MMSFVQRVTRLAVLTALLCLLSASSSLAYQYGWSTPVDIAAPEDEGRDLFGALLCDPWQNVHVLWGKTWEGGSGIYYRNDVAGDWSRPVSVLALPAQTAIRLSAVISPDGVLHLVWQDSWGGADSYYSRVHIGDAGDPTKWSQPQVLQERRGVSLAAAPDGTLHAFWGESWSAGLTVGLYHMSSDDGGMTWSDPLLVFSQSTPVPSGLSPAGTIDSDHRIHLGITIRSQEYGVFSELGYIRSRGGGTSWESYTPILEASEGRTNFSGIAPYVFDDEVHLTWHAPERMHMVSYDGGASFSQPREIMPLGAAFGGANQLTRTADGLIYVVTAVAGGVFSARWDGQSWSSPERIEDRWMDPHAQSIVACRGNELHVVYDDRHGEETTVWYSRRDTGAPPLPRLALPAREEELPPEPTADAGPTPTASLMEPTATTRSLPRTKDSAVPETAHGWEPILLAMASSSLILVTVFLWKARQS